MEKATAPAIQFSDYEKLVAQAAWKGHARLHKAGVVMDYEDVFQELCAVFCVARDKFDESKGYKFTTYLVTAMRHEFNRWAEPLINGRQLIASIEELSTHADAEGDMDLYGSIASDEPTPEQRVEQKQITMANLRGLSDNAKRVVRDLIEPSEAMIETFEAHKAHVAQGLAVGIKKRVLQDESIDLIMNHHNITRPASRAEVRAELKRKFGVKI